MNELLPAAIYVLCFVASSLCAGLLLRGYSRTGTRLLLWCGICFGFLSINNLAVVLDIVVFAAIDFQMLRNAAALAAVTTLLVGLVWESE